MSEDTCHIQTLGDGTIAASFSSCEIYEYTDESNERKMFEIHVNDSTCLSKQEFSNDVNDDVPEEQDTALEERKESNSQYNSNENVNFADPTSASTSVIRQTTVSPTCESDQTLLLKNRSPAPGPYLGLDVSRDDDNTSEVSIAGSCYSDRSCNNVSLVTAQTREGLMIPGSVNIPVIGHETMEARSKFTVFKLHVMVEEDETGWFIFRRYSDFVHLNDQLKVLFPSFRFMLPPKRWFKSNFDPDFLEERQQGLQTYIDNITGHRDICNSKPVKDFFCFDDPPGPHDTLEESRAQCECLEEMIYLLRKELSEKDTEAELLKEELDLYKNQVQLLSNRLSELNRGGTTDGSGLEKFSDRQSDRGLFGSGDLQFKQKLDFVIGSPDVKE